MRLLRMSLLRALVVIGTIAVVLWLIRTNPFWIICGTVVLTLSLHAADRRGRLANEIKTQGKSEKTLTILGLLGYSIAVFLGVVWVVIAVVSDAFEHSRP
jgi:hypothetical protein